MQLATYIHDLLHEHNCVVVPGFGGFVANYQGAQVNAVRHSFTAPNKKVLFNKNLVANDGLLCHHIAMANECTYEQAVAKVQNTVAIWNADLENGKLVELNKVGSLVLDTHSTIQFTQNTEENYLIDAFGLSSFQAIPIKRDSSAKQITKKVKDRKLVVAVAAKEPNNFKAIASYVIAAMLLLTILILPQRTDIAGNFTYASLNPFSKVSEPVYKATQSNIYFEEPTQVSMDYYENALDTDEPVYVTYVKGINKKIVVLPDNTDVSIDALQDFKFYIVAGCFKEKLNAENHVKNLRSKGYKAVIIGQNKYGLYRVGYQGFYDKAKALEAMLTIKIEDNQSAWLLTM